MYSRNWHTCDGLWFSGVEDRDMARIRRLKLTSTCGISHLVLKPTGSKRSLPFPDNAGLDEVLRTINFMSWAAKCEYRIEKNANSAVLTVTSCPPQEARIKSGKELFACRPTFEIGFSNVAGVIDPSVKVGCKYCPTGNHTPDSWCQWEFRDKSKIV